MRGIWVFTLPVALIATAASGATITVTSDKPVYDPGETIVLTVTGDPQGGTSYALLGVLSYSPALTETVTSSQTVHTTQGGAQEWIAGTLPRSDGSAYVVNQIFFGGGQIEGVTVDQIQVATATLIAEAGGVVDVSWSTKWGGQLEFFGLTSAQGTSFSITGPPPLPPEVEEPDPDPVPVPVPGPGVPGSDPGPVVIPGPDPDPYPGPPGGPLGGDPGSAVPEPSAALVFAVGLIAARAATRRRR